MQPSPETSHELNRRPSQREGRDWGKIGLRSGFFSLIGLMFGVVALVVTGGFAVFFGPLLFFPMVFINAGAAEAITLNGLTVAGLLTFGGPLLGGLMWAWMPSTSNNYLYASSFPPMDYQCSPAMGCGYPATVVDVYP